MPNVTLTLTGTSSGSTLSDDSANYRLSSLEAGGRGQSWGQSLLAKCQGMGVGFVLRKSTEPQAHQPSLQNPHFVCIGLCIEN